MVTAYAMGKARRESEQLKDTLVRAVLETRRILHEEPAGIAFTVDKLRALGWRCTPPPAAGKRRRAA